MPTYAAKITLQFDVEASNSTSAKAKISDIKFLKFFKTYDLLPDGVKYLRLEKNTRAKADAMLLKKD